MSNFRWSHLEESKSKFINWLQEKEDELKNLKLKPTIPEKVVQHNAYKTIFSDITAGKSDLQVIQEEQLNLQNSSDELDSVNERYEEVLRKVQKYLEEYEAIVNEHVKFDECAVDTKKWIEEKVSEVSTWGDCQQDRTNMLTNLDKLKNLKAVIRDEESRIISVKSSAKVVMETTDEAGHYGIRETLEHIEAEWGKLILLIDTNIGLVESRLRYWDDYEKLKEKCETWLANVDAELLSVNLKSTADEKKYQLDTLKTLQGQIRAKELEIDQVMDKAQQLNKGINKRNSQIPELEAQYQRVTHRVKEEVAKWQQYVESHQDLDVQIVHVEDLLGDLKERLAECENIKNATQKEIERKIGSVQAILLTKDDNFQKIQTLVELAQKVLVNTAPEGHQIINEKINSLQGSWSTITSHLIEVKNSLDNALTKWAGIIEEIQNLSKCIDWMKSKLDEHKNFGSNMSEKKIQLESLKKIEEKVRCDKIEADNLKQIADSIFSARQGEDIVSCQKIFDEFYTCVQNIQILLRDRESQFRDHTVYKEAYDELQKWMTRAQEKVPQLKQRPLSDRLSVETFSGPLDHLLNKKAQGEILIENLEHTAQVVLPHTSQNGQDVINNDIKALKESFERLFKDIKEQREQLEVILDHWREYKDEYERISDWLQQLAILVKNQKIVLYATLEDKQKQVETVKDLLNQTKNGEAQIKKLNEFAGVLLRSPLENHVNTQLQQLNSRYEVELNLAKDVLKKIENNYSQHKEYSENLEKCRNWIDNVKELIRICADVSSSTNRNTIQEHLNQIQNLMHEREIGQSLIHLTVNCGEKVVRNTRSDGKEAINSELKEIQSDWDRIVKKLSSVKVHLETALLQWADYDSSYHQLQQWISDREAKLQQVTEAKITKTGKTGLNALPISERKANLRATSNIMQDIVSFEPMIQSVTSKAEDLKQAAPASEISIKYESLSKQARDLYAKQKETIDSHQAFIDAGTDFVQWIRIARERLGKCSDPTGDKENLGSKLSQIKALQNELPVGQKKLEIALEKGEKACQLADEDDREIIEEEVGLLQDEYDNYTEMLINTKVLLEVGVVKWTEYEEQYIDALKWLSKKEEMIQTFNKLQSSLEDKRAVLEQFQLQLQTLFDWQGELDRLNMKAQTLLETCSDTRISNGITQLATKYSTILTVAKEIMRRLELHYQEHQQHSTLCQECQDWLDRTNEKLSSCLEVPNSLQEIKNKLQIIKNIRTSVEQGQNKLRYISELKEKVIINTEKSGAEKIQEVTENLKQDMEKLIHKLNTARNELSAKLTQLEEIDKLYKILSEVLEDVENQMRLREELLQDLTEKKSKLEKLKITSKELNSRKDLIERLESQIKDNDLSGQGYENCISKYTDLTRDLNELINSLENQVLDHLKFKKLYDDAFNWIKEHQAVIQNCTNLHEELDQIKEKGNIIETIIEELPNGIEIVHEAIGIGKNLMNSLNEAGQEMIEQDLEELNIFWEGFQYSCEESKKSLFICKNAWITFNKLHAEVRESIETAKDTLDELNKIEKYNALDLENAKSLEQRMVVSKEQLEELIDACDSVMEQCAIPWVRDKTVELQNTYTCLLTNIQNLRNKIEKSLSDHAEFIKSKSKFEQYLHEANTSVQECVGVDDAETMKKKLEKIVSYNAFVPKGEILLTSLQETFAKAVSVAPLEQQESFREDMSTLKKDWEQLNLNLASIQILLKSSLNRWKEHNENKESLLKWLRNTEDILVEKPDTKGDYSEMKTLSERYKNIKIEILNKQDDVDRFKNEANELKEWSKNNEVVDQANQILSLYENILHSCDRAQESIDAEMKDHSSYQQSLQEVEKWLLQTSFKLMNQNALYITNKEQTQLQINEQDKTIEEIRVFQHDLDNVKAKGQIQKERYSASTSFGSTIDKQLNNVQESYDSLLTTALQIKSRLIESLRKFEEYENILNDIMKKIDNYEPEISKIASNIPNELAEARHQLDVVKDMNENLHAEKSRLALAIQACESAASMSRPGSPRDIHAPTVPTRELECKARLGDIMDQEIMESLETSLKTNLLFEHLEEPGMNRRLQPLLNVVQTQMILLSSVVADLEHKEQLKTNLQQWIEAQRIMINDWKSRPIKLRSDATQQDFNTMNELLISIGQRKQQSLTDFSEPENVHFESSLNSLENELLDLISLKQSHQNLIDEYRKTLQNQNSWIDSLMKQVENVDKGSGLNCQQKYSAILELKADFEERSPLEMDRIRTMGATIISIVNNLDSQQIEEQIKSVERRNNDIEKRLQRKLQIFEMTQKGIDDTKDEIEKARHWVETKQISLRKQEPLGFEVYKADDRLNTLKALLKETDSKHLLKDTLLKRVNNMVNELEPTEKMYLENLLKGLGNDQEELIENIRKEIDKTISAMNTRKNLESSIEKAKHWLQAKIVEVKKLSAYLPLQSSEVKREMDQQRAYAAEIKVFGEGDMNDLMKLGNSLLKECTGDDKIKLQLLLNELKQEYDNLKEESNQKLNAANDLYEGRKEFENAIDKCVAWLKEADVATKSEIRSPNLENLEEQLTKYLKLLDESDEIHNDIDKIVEQAKAIFPTISESDKYSLHQKLDHMKQWHDKIADLIRSRTDILKQNILQLREAKNKISESIQFIKDIQDQLKDLNKPIGSKVEDVKGVLAIYENILKDLKENKSKLNDVPDSDEMQNVLSTQDELIQSIEDQISKLRQLLLLREQFITLITDIMTFITKYTEIIRDIERAGGTVEEKIEKYDDAIIRIQECEAVLASAYDKGQQICKDCNVQDQNSITEQLQSLKNSLLSLRRAVEKQRQEHENTAAEHKKLASTLDEILDFLHSKEAQAKSRPLLRRNLSSVEENIEQHKSFAHDIQTYLEKIRIIQQNCKNDDCMPGSLLDKLSEANSLLNSLPKELELREAYLTSNKIMRESFENLKQKFSDWIKEAHIRLDYHKRGIDFENVMTDLEEHKIFFSTEANMKELISTNIQKIADEIWPSLESSEQEELSKEQQNLTQTLKNTLNSAKSQKALLEQSAELWKEYCHSMDKVESVIARTKFVDEPVSTLAGLHFNIQKISHAINDIQVVSIISFLKACINMYHYENFLMPRRNQF